jgi:hypothetical protein
MAFMVTVLFSGLSYQYSMLKPFAEFEEADGLFYCGGVSDLSNYGNNEYVEKNYQCYTNSFYVEEYEINTTVYAYQSWIWENWKARLSEGTWFDENSTSEEIPIVVAGAGDLFSVGDVIEATTSDTSVPVRLKVIGIVMEDTKILNGATRYNAGEINYQMFYDVPYDGVFFLMQYECLQEKGIICNAGMNHFIFFKENTPETEKTALERTIFTETGHYVKTLKDFFEESKADYMQAIISYIPVAGICMILIIMCSIAAAYVNLSHNYRMYGINFLLGAKRRQQFLIICINTLGNIVVSLFCLRMIVKVVDATGLYQKFMLTIHAQTIYILAAYYVIYAVVMILVNMVAFFKITPAEMVKHTNRV